MRILYFLLLCGTFTGALANDGSFYAAGNSLIPLKETTIQMKKEILSLDRKGDWMQVDIYFEFFNPGPEKELTVGFVTPPAFGDITEAEEAHPQVKNFMVMTGDRILPYKIARMDESGFKVSSKLAEGFDFVYYFTIRFTKGITVIRHSYLYRGGASVEATHDFLYRLTTGATWAGGSIGDFELNINMGDDCYFAVPSSFGSTAASWTLVGVGRIGAATVFNPYGDEEGGRILRMVYLRKGKLQLRQLNFKPQKDLGLTVFQFHNEVNLWTDKKTPHVFENSMDLMMGDSTDVLLRRMTDLELRLYRNLHFARMGYDFKDEALKKVFMQFTWYIPDPAIKAENAPDYYLSKELLKLITEEESRRKAGRNAPAEQVISHSACRHGRQHTRQECKSSTKYEVRSTALRMERLYWHPATGTWHLTTKYSAPHKTSLLTSHIPQLTSRLPHLFFPNNQPR